MKITGKVQFLIKSNSVIPGYHETTKKLIKAHSCQGRRTREGELNKPSERGVPLIHKANVRVKGREATPRR